MKRSPRPAAIPSKLSASIHQQLNSYALAAGAAGVGILALSQPAQAKIVYAAANVHIDRFVLNQLTFDHKTEFLLLATGDFNSTTIHGTSRLVARALGRNGVEGSGGNASALNAGSVNRSQAALCRQTLGELLLDGCPQLHWEMVLRNTRAALPRAQILHSRGGPLRMGTLDRQYPVGRYAHRLRL